jgi:hypothetical protein
MFTNKLKELESAKAKLAALEKTLAAELDKELAALPAKYGFASTADFISAVKVAGKGRTGGAAKAGKGRRRRAVITDDTRARVKAMVAAGKTGEAIADAVGISLPSVQNIKKALGLVKARKK